MADGIVRVGGQALADGVLMRTGRAWAIARADGSVEVGDVPPARGSGIPGLRVLLGLASGLKLGMGRGLLARPRGGNGRFLLVILALEVVLLVSPLALPDVDVPPAVAVPASALPWILSLVVIRLAAPAQMWRYHGAEHKAVAAHEAGAAPGDVAAALAAPRVHDRCGTNLVFLLVIAGYALTAIPGVWQIPAFLAVLAGAVELLNLAGRFRGSRWSRVLLAGGRFLQARVTTAEPDWGEQHVACRALAAAVERHHELTAAPVDVDDAVEPAAAVS